MSFTKDFFWNLFLALSLAAIQALLVAVCGVCACISMLHSAHIVRPLIRVPVHYAHVVCPPGWLQWHNCLWPY